MANINFSEDSFEEFLLWGIEDKKKETLNKVSFCLKIRLAVLAPTQQKSGSSPLFILYSE